MAVAWPLPSSTLQLPPREPRPFSLDVREDKERQRPSSQSGHFCKIPAELLVDSCLMGQSDEIWQGDLLRLGHLNAQHYDRLMDCCCLGQSVSPQHTAAAMECSVEQRLYSHGLFSLKELPRNSTVDVQSFSLDGFSKLVVI